MTDCTDVCNAVMDRLEEMGFNVDLDVEEPDHGVVLKALSQVVFVKKEIEDGNI